MIFNVNMVSIIILEVNIVGKIMLMYVSMNKKITVMIGQVIK